jgi:membrane-associated protein
VPAESVRSLWKPAAHGRRLPGRPGGLPYRGRVVAALNPLDAHSLISAFGTLGIAAVIFAETGLLVGFFLPGDSLLFTAGILCATPVGTHLHLNLAAVLPLVAVAAVAGGQVGYLIGIRAGRPLFARSTKPQLQAGLVRAEEVMGRYGQGKALVLARFIPVVRTVMNPLAGVLRVPLGVFTLWNVVGGVLWSIGVTLAGFWLGKKIPNIDHYLLPIIAVIVALSLVPLLLEYRRHRARRVAAAPTEEQHRLPDSPVA